VGLYEDAVQRHRESGAEAQARELQEAHAKYLAQQENLMREYAIAMDKLGIRARRYLCFETSGILGNYTVVQRGVVVGWHVFDWTKEELSSEVLSGRGYYVVTPAQELYNTNLGGQVRPIPIPLPWMPKDLDGTPDPDSLASAMKIALDDILAGGRS